MIFTMKDNVQRIIFIALGLILFCQVTLAEVATLELLDGTTFRGRVISLTGKQLLFEEAGKENSAGKARAIPAGEVSLLEFLPAKGVFAEKGWAIVETNFGDVFRAEKLQLAEGLLTCASVDLPEGELKIPIEVVQRILLPAKNETASQIRNRILEGKEYRASSRDMLIIEGKEGKWTSPLGVLLKITDSKIFFNYRQADRTIKRKIVRAVILSAPVKAEKLPAGYLTTSDGSRYGFASLQIKDKSILLESSVLGQLKLDRADVAEFRFRSDRVMNLTGLTPNEVTERGFFDTTFAYRTDRAVGGGPIRLAGRTYKSGLGMHSYSRLTYDLGGKFQTFVAVVGIDDAARPGGNASLTVLADGKKVFGPVVLTGRDKPIDIRADITGAEKLTIEVDFGPDGLGAGDHVDIANAKLIKAK